MSKLLLAFHRSFHASTNISGGINGENSRVYRIYIFFYLCFRPKLDVKRGKKKKGKKYIFIQHRFEFYQFFPPIFPTATRWERNRSRIDSKRVVLVAISLREIFRENCPLVIKEEEAER